MPTLTELATWKKVLSHAQPMRTATIGELFSQNPLRFQQLHLKAGGLLADFSRQRVTAETLALLLACLEAQNFENQRRALFAGETVNATENRAAMHMAQRGNSGDAYRVLGQPVMEEVLHQRTRALSFAEAVRAGKCKGASGKPITTILHIGIGGSDLGPRLLASAFADRKAPAIHFIGNVDGAPLREIMDTAAPAQTLVIIASKTFTTAETMRNAATLRDWLVAAGGKDAIAGQMVAVTAAPDAAKAFGVAEEQTFLFQDWVGGRYSISSPVALPAMIVMGEKNFTAFLGGMREMDLHFRDAPLRQNLPVLLAALEIWNVNILGFAARAVIPYAEALAALPQYLEQLEMESLGKRADREGRPLPHAAAPVVFGVTGTPAQHAFMQALHQGAAIIPADILLVKEDNAGLPDHHHMLNANALAQAEALAFGQKDADAHKQFPGNRPCTVLALDALTPAVLGQLIALFEHKVFSESAFWNLNPFDQWGVELGKRLAGPIEAALRAGSKAASPSPSLEGLLAYLRNN
jgi:glucose-6-phosphate isomerase